VSQRGKALPECSEISTAERNQLRQRFRLGINAIQLVGIDHGVSHISDLKLASDLPCDCAFANTGNSTYHEDVHEEAGRLGLDVHVISMSTWTRDVDHPEDLRDLPDGV